MSSYIDESLSKGEHVVARFELHWNMWIPIILLYVSIVGIPFAIAKHVGLRSREQGLTNRRVISKRGVVSRDTFEMPLSSIETVTIHQTGWGRVFGYGMVRITGRGITDVDLADVRDPMEVKRAIESEKYNPEEA